MTDKISQIYEEEQVNKARNGRNSVPDSKMPNLQWNLEKQEKTEEIGESEEAKQPLNKIQEAIICAIVFIYSILISIQHFIGTTTKTIQEQTTKLTDTTRQISHTSWLAVQKEIQRTWYHLRTKCRNRRNQSYRTQDNPGATISPSQ